MGVVLHFYCFAFNRRRHRHLQLRKRVMKSWGLSCIDGFAKRDLEELLQEHGFSCE